MEKPQIRRQRVKQTSLPGPRSLLGTLPPRNSLTEYFFVEFTVMDEVCDPSAFFKQTLTKDLKTMIAAKPMPLWMPNRLEVGQ